MTFSNLEFLAPRLQFALFNMLQTVQLLGEGNSLLKSVGHRKDQIEESFEKRFLYIVGWFAKKKQF